VEALLSLIGSRHVQLLLRAKRRSRRVGRQHGVSVMVLHIAAQARQWQNRQMEPRPKGGVGRFRPGRWIRGLRSPSSRVKGARRLGERAALLLVGLVLGAIGTAQAVSES